MSSDLGVNKVNDFLHLQPFDNKAVQDKDFEEKFIYVFKYDNDNIFGVRAKLNYKYSWGNGDISKEDIYDIVIYQLNGYEEFYDYNGDYKKFNIGNNFHLYDLTDEQILEVLNDINQDINKEEDYNPEYLILCDEWIAVINRICSYEKYRIKMNESHHRWVGCDYGIFYNVILAVRLKLLIDYDEVSDFTLESMQPNFTVFNSDTYEFEQLEVESWEKIKKDLFNYKLNKKLPPKGDKIKKGKI